MDDGSEPPNPAAGFLRWEAGKPVRKSVSLIESDENVATRQYKYVRRDNQTAPQGRKRKPTREHRPDVVGPLKRHLTNAELINRNKLVMKPMRQKILQAQNNNDPPPPNRESPPHCSRNRPTISAETLPNGPVGNSRPRLAFEFVTCGARCRKEGCEMIPREYRRRIYDEFGEMTNDEKYFVMRTLMHLRRDSGRQESGINNKTKSWQYNLVFLQQNLQVCRSTFMGSLGVSKTQLDALHDRMGDAHESVFFRNMTGRHDTRPHKMSQNVFEHVVEFLSSKDRVDNHYSRGKIEGDVKLLDKKYTYASLFKEYDTANQIPPFKLSATTFRKIMRCEGFFVGEAYNDTCGTCDKLQVMLEIASAEEKDVRIQEKATHLQEVELAKKEKTADIEKAKADETYVVLSVDMQQTIFSPKLTCGPAFYSRKFATNNFGIHNERTGKGSFYIWNEIDARRGADEIASAIYNHVRANYEILQIGEERTLVIWSDRCCGQNNNWTMLVLYRKLISMRIFTDVYQKFAISGHSYLSCDRDFGVIEKVLRRVTVKVPTELPRLINDAANNFQAMKLRQQSFFTFEPLVQYWQRPPTLKVTKCISFYQNDKDPKAIYTRKTHDVEEQFSRHVALQNENLNPKKIPKIDQRKYTEPLRLDVLKKQDLVKLMRWLTPAQREFYLPHILPRDDEDGPRGGDVDLYGRTDEHPFIRMESLED